MRRGRYFPQELKDAMARAALWILRAREWPTFHRALREIEQTFDVSEPTARDLIKRGRELRRGDQFARIRALADQALAGAERTTDSDQRRTWLAIAESWKQTAMHLGTNSGDGLGKLDANGTMNGDRAHC